jgi:hypothetical protein
VSTEQPIRYDAGLVEAAVLLAEGREAPAVKLRFRAERDRIYECKDADEREARFEELHGRFFVQLGLDCPLHAVLAEYPDVLRRASSCHALRTLARRDEGADLRDDLSPDGQPAMPRPMLVLRLRPESLLDAVRLVPFLRRELQHVADMLDPAFGYERELPPDGADPARANLLRERYRLVWETTVEGRLSRRHGIEPQARAARLAEFARAFPSLDAEREFAAWFDAAAPTHAAILGFAAAAGQDLPLGSMVTAAAAAASPASRTCSHRGCVCSSH